MDDYRSICASYGVVVVRCDSERGRMNGGPCGCDRMIVSTLLALLTFPGEQKHSRSGQQGLIVKHIMPSLSYL